MKGRCNIDRGLRFSDIRNRCESTKSRAVLRDVKANRKENVRFSHHHSNSVGNRSSNPRDSRHPSNSILSLETCNARGNQRARARSLTVNLKEEGKDIENRDRK